MLLHMVAPHGPLIFTDFQPADPSPLTESGPVTISSNGQIVQDLDITATGGTDGISVNSGVTNMSPTPAAAVRTCRSEARAPTISP
jgi:hypothetical protein